MLVVASELDQPHQCHVGEEDLQPGPEGIVESDQLIEGEGMVEVVDACAPKPLLFRFMQWSAKTDKPRAIETQTEIAVQMVRRDRSVE